MLINDFYLLSPLFFLQFILCKSSFDAEYPGVKICQSGNIQDFSIHTPETRWTDIKNIISNNCTHLQGSLYIRGLRNITKMGKTINSKEVLLDSIKEIDGHLIIEGNDVEIISLKKLVVIRGILSKSYTLLKSNENISISLQVTGNPFLKYLNLQSLRSIANHDVLFHNNPQLRYLPHKINWTELFQPQKAQRMHSNIPSQDMLSRDVCDRGCYVWTKNNDSFCWGPSKAECQIKTYCEKNVDDCKICLYKNGEENNCCDLQCLGGCNKFGPENCVACANQLDGKKCIESCPSEYSGGIAGTKQKKAFKYFSGFFCSSTCPANMLPQDNLCVAHCGDGYFKNESNHCVKCYGDKCKKEDILCDMMKMISGEERDYILHEKLLVQLTNCTKIRGYIVITKHSFDRYNVTVKMLYDHLSNLEYLEGGFNYFVDNHLTNLTFLSKLKVFRETNLHAYTQGSPSYNKFLIASTSLQFLGLKSLRNVTGLMLIAKNNDLCYLNLPWSEIGYPKPNILDKPCPNKICDKSCSNKGCWMSSNKWCYECERFDAGGQCVFECSLANGFFLLNKSVSVMGQKNVPCNKCDQECAKTCRGTTPADCIGGCVHREENGVCVNKCSLFSYEEKGTNKCLPCHKSCTRVDGIRQCTGPSNKPGLGGCTKCGYILINRSNDIRQIDSIVNCVSECPSRTFARATSNENITNFFPNIGYVCEKCSRLCQKCTGRRSHKDDCQMCDGFWNKDMCVKSCPKDSTYGHKTLDSSKVCLRCDVRCFSGCSGPMDYNCKKCKDRKIYVNSTIFYCAKSCPVNKNFEEKEPETGDFVCKGAWESVAKLEEARRTKVVISVVIIMLLIIIVVITLVVICLRRKAMADQLEAKLKALYSNLTEPNSKDENAFSKPPNMGRLVIISIEDLIFEDQTRPLGFGAFGYVYKGKWKVPKEEDMLISKSAGDFYLPVAIKVIKNIGVNQHDEIMQEAKIMSSVSHMHCLRFIGICLSYEMPCLVTAYVKEGSLDKYLVRNRTKITSQIMLSWAEQIADGMFYLKKRGIIHRDLAARNVLVSQFECVQITDFGLSKMLETTNEKEIVIKSGKVPIRWLAIETLLEGRYSHETDVWAYGVTLWEIFTFGKVPYEDQATLDISDFVLKGGRLPQPDICSLDVYIVLVNCWLESPNLRPDFEGLMRTFMDYCKNPGRYLSIQGDPFEIPSPSNIEMTNLNNPYFDQYNTSPGTAETLLPLMNGRDSMNVALIEDNVDKYGLTPVEEESKKLLPGEEDLPTRVSTRKSNLFKLFHDKNQSITSDNSIDTPGNTNPKLVPLASLEEPSFRSSVADEEPRYVSDPSDKTVRFRQSELSPRTKLSPNPRLNSYQPSLNSMAPPMNDDTDGYLDPINSPIKSQISVPSDDGYLEPVTTKNKQSVDKDDYMIPSYTNSPRESIQSNYNNNSRLPSMARQSTKMPSLCEDGNPSNLYFPNNLVEDEYLEPSSKSSLIK